MTKSRRARPKVPKEYPGELGDPGLLRQALGNAEISDILSGRAQQQHESRMLSLLAKHYSIEGTDPLEIMANLALALARDHVPAFVLEPPPRRRGRPSRSLGDILVGADKSQRRRGAPLQWTESRYRDLLSLVEDWRAALRRQGEPVTNAAAIAAAMRQVRTDGLLSGWSDRDIQDHAKAWARRVPDARRALRKIPGK